MKQKSKFKQTEIGMIPEDWQVENVENIKADEKRSIISGPFGSNIGSRFFVSKGIPVIRGNNLTENMNKFIDHGFVFLTKEKAEELGTWAKREDIIFTAAGTIGQVGLIPNNSRYKEYIISNKQLRLRVNPTKILPIFAFYWFSSKLMVRYIKQRNTGSSVPLINLSVLRNLPIVRPSIEEQTAIVSILSSLDLRIELNQSMNKILESIGQVIFKHWFVDFEFPNEKGKSYKSSGGEMIDSEAGEIPAGWQVKQLKSVLNLLKDGSHNPPKRVDTGIKFIAGATDIKHFSIRFDKCTFVSREFYEEFHKKWKIKADDILYTIVGTVGNIALVRKEDFPFTMQRSIAILRSNEEINQFYLYFLMNESRFLNEIKGKINPTAQPGIYLGEIGKTSIIVPSDKLLHNFSNAVIPLVRKMQENINNIQSLSVIRDFLLPRLMSGEIRVSVEV